MTNIHRSLRLQRCEFLVAGTGAIGWFLVPRALFAAQPGPVGGENLIGTVWMILGGLRRMSVT